MTGTEMDHSAIFSSSSGCIEKNAEKWLLTYG